MPRLPLSRNGDSAFERLLGHNAAVLEAWRGLEEALFTSPTFTPELREQVRRALAFGNQCQYCMAKAGPPDHLGIPERDQIALALADLIGRDHRDILPEQIDLIAGAYGPAAAAELLALCSFLTASQMFGALTGLTAEDLPGR